jgi:spermidine synthase
MIGSSDQWSEEASARRWVLVAMGALGVSAVMTQLALLRELLGAFSGNELVIGLILGLWLLLTGLGTWLGRGAGRLREPLTWLLVVQGAIALLPLVQVIVVRALRDQVFLRGAEVSLAASAWSTGLLLLPYCVASGYLLMLGCAILSSGSEADGPGRVYVADAVGSVAGGVAFTFVLVPVFDHVALLVLPAVLNLLVIVLLARSVRRRWAMSLGAAGLLVLLGVVLSCDLDALSTAAQFPGQSVLFRANSPYGRIVVTRAAGQLNVFENGLPVLATQHPERAEETVHYAMAQRPDAARVLLVSGGASGTALEVLKYPQVREVVYVELDPLILGIAHHFLSESLADERIRTVNTDGRRFILETTERFGVAILDLPDPSTAQLNRFYTAEFFAEVKRVLTPGGVLAFGLGRYENYVSPELAAVLGLEHRTLRSAFSHTLVLPGGRVFFLASAAPLFTNVAERLDERGIPRQFVTHSYLDATLTPDRLADMQGAVSGTGGVNRDFSPQLYYRHLRHWLSQFGNRLDPLVWGLAGMLAVCLVWLRAGSRVIFASGFGASTLQLVLLLAHQVLFGSLYRQVGLLVTLFMLGLATGGMLGNRLRLAPSGRALAWLALAVALFAAGLPWLLPELRTMSQVGAAAWVASAVIPGLTLILAVLVGMQFPLANRLRQATVAEAAARIYTADFAGAGLGALLASAWLLPVWGLVGTCGLTAALNLWAGLALLVRNTRS